MTLSGLWDAAITTFQLVQRADDLADSTVRLRGTQLRDVGRRIGEPNPWALSPHTLVAWLRAQPWKADTLRSHRTTLRAFYAWGVTAGLIEVSPALSIKRIRPAQPHPQAAPDEVYLSALAVAGARERIMLRLAAVQGLRCCEIAVVHSRDLVEDLDGWSLVVHGKGKRDRLVPLAGEVARLLRAQPPGWVFPGGVEGHLSRQYVGVLIRRLLPGAWTAHKLRHRAGTRVYRSSGNDIRLTAAFLGHADTKTTMVYVEPDGPRMRAAIRDAA